jgi:hypothetical protein
MHFSALLFTALAGASQHRPSDGVHQRGAEHRVSEDLWSLKPEPARLLTEPLTS